MTAIQVNPIHIAYAVMIMGVIFAFVFSKRTRGDMRTISDDFAFAFAKLSNHICPNKIKKELLLKQGDGAVTVLPFNEQPAEIQAIIRRANDKTSVKLFADMVDAANRLREMAGFNRTRKVQFAEPIDEILEMTHSFLVSCENIGSITTKEQKENFDSFLYEQVKHRMTLLRRISGQKGEEYRQLNRLYAKEMEESERQEWEKKQGKNRK